ncbi:hypothetical protein [Flavobacterium sp. UBA4197]|uniref:hypothetical protein n=1 Tax=Flavobacterium sp. UBA4197 TaxID=1946546 RepID=UPI00257EC3AE|nr:hypothetical protein [Flavobacterium sp. UBA4197]
MKYAQTNYSGNNYHTHTTATKTVTPTIKRVRKLDATTKRCKRGSAGQAAICPDSNVTNGFLKSSFLPKLEAPENFKACSESQKTESDFYLSLDHLAKHYHLTPMQSKQYGYPYNIALALNDIETQLSSKIRDWEELRLIQQDKKTYFTTEERYNTRATLYYIPVIPLFEMLNDSKRKKAAQLLLSVCSYLYHIAAIPYYRQEDSYLYSMYEMMTDWLLCDDQDENISAYGTQITQAEIIGDRMEQKIYNHHNLSRFSARLNSFKITNQFERDCFKLANESFAIYEQYPDQNIFRNVPSGKETEDDDEENSIGMEKYVSFCADDKGLLFDTLFESVNTEFQEYAQTEEPIIFNRFNGKNANIKSLDFETRVFAIIDDLIYLLNNFQT